MNKFQVTTKEIHDAIKSNQVRELKKWADLGELPQDRLRVLRFGKNKDTVLHLAIASIATDAFRFFANRVEPRVLEKENGARKSPLEMIDDRIDAITSQMAKGDDFYDSLVYAAGNQRGVGITQDERWEWQELGKMKEILQEVISKRVGAAMMGIATDSGSLDAVKAVHKHFPDMFAHTEQDQIMDMIEHLDSLGHDHVSDYIASQLE